MTIDSFIGGTAFVLFIVIFFNLVFDHGVKIMSPKVDDQNVRVFTQFVTLPTNVVMTVMLTLVPQMVMTLSKRSPL